MAESTAIQWCDHTFNPWRGCTKVAAGCANCYAEATAKRNPGVLGIWGDDGRRVVAAEYQWKQVEKWNREAERKICECSTLNQSAIAKALGASESVCMRCGNRVTWERPRVFVASLADVFEDWQGPMSSAQGERLFWSHRRTEDNPSEWHWVPESHTAGGETPITMNDIRTRLFRLIDDCQNLDFLLLTKRPENIRDMWPTENDGHKGNLAAAVFSTKAKCPSCGDVYDSSVVDYHSNCPCGRGFADLVDIPAQGRLVRNRNNVWLITSIANQEDADRSIPELLKCRHLAPVLGVSAEPLVGPVDLRSWGGLDLFTCQACGDEISDGEQDHYGLSPCCRQALDPQGSTPPELDWVIVGGESGHNARTCNVDWIRSLVRQCKDAGTACFVKQLGAYPTTPMTNGEGERPLDFIDDKKGGDPEEWPEDLRVREFPR